MVVVEEVAAREGEEQKQTSRFQNHNHNLKVKVKVREACTNPKAKFELIGRSFAELRAKFKTIVTGPTAGLKVWISSNDLKR